MILGNQKVYQVTKGFLDYCWKEAKSGRV